MVLPGKAVVDSPDFVAVADSKALGLVKWITHREYKRERGRERGMEVRWRRRESVAQGPEPEERKKRNLSIKVPGEVLELPKLITQVQTIVIEENTQYGLRGTGIGDHLENARESQSEAEPT